MNVMALNSLNFFCIIRYTQCVILQRRKQVKKNSCWYIWFGLKNCDIKCMEISKGALSLLAPTEECSKRCKSLNDVMQKTLNKFNSESEEI